LAENQELQKANHDNHQYHTLRDSLIAGKKEFAIAFIIIAVYFYLWISNIQPMIMILFGFIAGTWLAFRPSEWAVEGIESVAGHRGFTTYVAGMLSSLVSNMPEAVVSVLSATDGYISGDQSLLDIAILSVLVAAGFNMFLLGLTVILLTREQGDLEVPEEAIKKDAVLIRWTIVALLSMFALGVVDAIFLAEGAPSSTFPTGASLVLFVSYVIYSIFLMRGEVTEEVEFAQPHHSMRDATVLLAIGFIGIFIAGDILTESAKLLLDEYHDIISNTLMLNPVAITALILGAVGSLPEHGIALVAASKGKANIAVGNLVGGVLQIVLLVSGGIGIIVPIPLDRYVLFQIIVIAGSLWFLKRAIADDHRLDTFEGLMIILLQAYVFTLLIFGTPVGVG
jgi:cation:H+ antiporter